MYYVVCWVASPVRVKTVLVLRLNVPTTCFSVILREDLFWKQTAKQKIN